MKMKTRFALPNSRFLIQKVGMDTPFRGQSTDIALEVANVLKANESVLSELSKMTGQPLSKIQADCERDFYLSAEEAEEYGMVDKVLYPGEGVPADAKGGDKATLGDFSTGQGWK